MYKAPFYTRDGTPGAERELPSWLFDGRVSESALHLAVTATRSNQRQGTGSAKNRAAVAGGSRKPWRQKGTGRARQGTIRAAQWVGGGRAFPPQPHSWRKGLPKKLRRLARHSAFNVQAEEGRVVLVEAFDDEGPATRRLVGYLRTIGVEDDRALLLTSGIKRNVYLSGRNVRGMEVRPFGEESAYDVLRARTVLIEVDALEAGEPPETGGARKRARGEQVAPEPEHEAPVSARRLALRERAAAKAAAVAAAAGAGPAPKAKKPRAEPEKAKKSAKKKGAAPAAEAPLAPGAKGAVRDEESPAPRPTAPAAEEIELPKVSELAGFLTGLTETVLIEALRDRDSRKTAAPHYARRLAELEEGADDA